MTRAGFAPWITAGQRLEELRTDLPADRLTEWLLAVVDGYVGRLAATTGFDAVAERELLADLVARLVHPASTSYPG